MATASPRLKKEGKARLINLNDYGTIVKVMSIDRKAKKATVRLIKAPDGRDLPGKVRTYNTSELRPVVGPVKKGTGPLTYVIVGKKSKPKDPHCGPR